MTQNRRQEAIDGFRGGKYDILVATDIAARGIDVSEISHVINYDMPDTVDAYTHRIGRTGRAHLTGEAFTFVGPDDELLVRDIERLLGKRIERRRLAEFDYGGFSPEAPAQPQTASQAPAKNGSQPRRAQTPQRPQSSPVGQSTTKGEGQSQRARPAQRPQQPQPAGQPRPHSGAGQSRAQRQSPTAPAGAPSRKEDEARRRRQGQPRQPYGAHR
jgi:ATP-dependent RNA helicase RhlE